MKRCPTEPVAPRMATGTRPVRAVDAGVSTGRVAVIRWAPLQKRFYAAALPNVGWASARPPPGVGGLKPRPTSGACHTDGVRCVLFMLLLGVACDRTSLPVRIGAASNVDSRILAETVARQLERAGCPVERHYR